ncbi:uncharacterized protein TRUGW13939_06524 [Talaromyces rugulosus]|uniref:Uncharacterized protein n=1 Tax=Talaromyces rugulosus TaxID=121627 RepID=A0A7H8QZ69_TALRU|nr:uncharacterized protein TRUGW13939_06524 [Talaromyces rugulosus]QKX59390.1 hypothetical protein TRUGW13939_06524 [Talaromyces rugulosus]
MLVLPEDQLNQLLLNLDQTQCETILQTLSDALATCSAQAKSIDQNQQQQIHQPLRSSIVTNHGDTTLFMPVSDTLSTGIKVVAVPHNGPIRGVINVLSAQGALLGVISAAEVTAFRTALATMTLFSRCKGLFSKSRVIVFGAGRQAEWHARLALLLSATEIEAITFINRGQDRLDQMMAGLLPDLKQRYPNLKVNAYAKSSLAPGEYVSRLNSDLAESSVLFCCTPSTEPLFAYDTIAANNRRRFISMIGSYKPHMQEIDKQTLLSGTEGRIYVDSKHACLKEAGELIMAGVQESQLVEAGDVFGQDPNLVVEKGPGAGNIVFKCVGMGIMDLVVAKTLLDMGAEKGLGTKVDF